ncbi:hypothetical protein DR64_7754 [Paraburkholderia xenovorans LB400]|nr:hypothetical protein DR64_7754 [Paraburkholderia xenovorans LB400]
MASSWLIGLPGVFTRHRNPCVPVRRIVVEAQKPACKVLGENRIDC